MLCCFALVKMDFLCRGVIITVPYSGSVLKGVAQAACVLFPSDEWRYSPFTSANTAIALESGWSFLQGINYYEVFSERLHCANEKGPTSVTRLIQRLQMVVTSNPFGSLLPTCVMFLRLILKTAVQTSVCRSPSCFTTTFIFCMRQLKTTGARVFVCAVRLCVHVRVCACSTTC